MLKEVEMLLRSQELVVSVHSGSNNTLIRKSDMHKSKSRFWQWIKSDGALIAASVISSAVGSLIGSVLEVSFSGFSGIFLGAIVGAVLGVLLGHYLQKKLSTLADQYLSPHELFQQQVKIFQQQVEKNREAHDLKRKAEQEKSSVEMFAVVYLGYNADIGCYRFRQKDNNGLVYATVKDFSGGIGTGNTLIFRRLRGSLNAVVERV